jgi:protein arginine kinase activator
MQCMKCKKNEASYYFKQNINGKVTESALCHECAHEANQNAAPKQISFNPFSGFFGINAPQARRAAETVKRCTLCGSGFTDLLKSGKIGCAKCYEVFNDELAATIAKLHGQTTHIGRAPLEHRAKNDRRIRERKLKAELRKAIEAQDFEKAATLRDEINKDETNKQDKNGA